MRGGLGRAPPPRAGLVLSGARGRFADCRLLRSAPLSTTRAAHVATGPWNARERTSARRFAPCPRARPRRCCDGVGSSRRVASHLFSVSPRGSRRPPPPLPSSPPVSLARLSPPPPLALSAPFVSSPQPPPPLTFSCMALAVASSPLLVRAPRSQVDNDRCIGSRLEDVKNVHFTVCQKPWKCIRGDSGLPPLCAALHAEVVGGHNGWWTYRRFFQRRVCSVEGKCMLHAEVGAEAVCCRRRRPFFSFRTVWCVSRRRRRGQAAAAVVRFRLFCFVLFCFVLSRCFWQLWCGGGCALVWCGVVCASAAARRALRCRTSRWIGSRRVPRAPPPVVERRSQTVPVRRHTVPLLRIASHV